MTEFKKANAYSLIKRSTFSWYTNFPKVFVFLNIHRWFNIINIAPHGPDDGSLEPKHYSVYFDSQ